MPWTPKVIVIAAALFLVAVYAMFCSSRDISGTYTLVKCVDVDTAEIGERAGASATLNIKGISGRRYFVEHVGGNNDGARLVGELVDDRLVVKIGTAPVIYTFTSGYSTIDFNGYNGRCTYEKAN